MIASLLVARQEDKRWIREAKLESIGFTIRDILGLDELSAEKQQLLASLDQSHSEQQHDERAPKRRKIELLNPWRFPLPFVERFPALARRNFYIIQWHHATSLHYDLRLQCSEAHPEGRCHICATDHRLDEDGRLPATISFAMKKGLSAMKYNEKRLAIETPLHGIDYSVHEGGGVGTTLLYDIGYYEVVSGATSARDKGADTDDENDEELEQPVYGGAMGINHERALAKSYRGETGAASTSFVIRLTGLRYQIQLAMSHQKTDVKYGQDKLRGCKTVRKQWVVGLASNGKGKVFLNKERDIGSNSILTSRSMEQLKAEGDALTGSGTAAVLEDPHESDLEDTGLVTSS